MVVTRATRNRFVGVEPARGFESHHLRQKPITEVIGFFIWLHRIRGFEPERVLPFGKQCGTLFSGKRAERTKRGQLVCKAKPQQTANPTISAKIAACSTRMS